MFVKNTTSKAAVKSKAGREWMAVITDKTDGQRPSVLVTIHDVLRFTDVHTFYTEITEKPSL